MESLRAKINHIIHPTAPSEAGQTFGQPSSSRPNNVSTAPRQKEVIEIGSSDDEGPLPNPHDKPPRPPKSQNSKAEYSPFIPAAPRFPTAYVDGKPLGPQTSYNPYAPSSSQPPPNQQPVPIRPQNYSVPAAVPLNNNGDADEEQFVIDTRPEYEDRTTADEAQRAMRDLLAGAVGAIDINDVDMNDAVVEGFNENFRLMPHQIQGRAWMRERETGKKAGGILADDMGLGKTIQSLTRITEGKPSKEDLKKAKLSKTNLIICPVSVLPQWAEEIEKMTEGLLVVRHHGPSRTTNPEILKRADVVITTYSTLTSEHKVHTGSAGRDASKKKAAEEEKKKEEESDSDDSLIGRSLPKKKIAPKRATKEKPKLSALFQVGFWRIFLDEAQNIKNRSSKAALACWALEAKYRWVLTGTPIQNSVDELYPLFRFLKIRPLNDWDNFSSVISKPVKDGRSKNAMKRLHVVLNATMLRRTKNQQINGKPIIVLPPRTVEVIPCDFDEDERSFYTAVEARTSLQMNKFIEKGTVMENYTSVLVLLLRLRQACDHPALLSKDFVKDLDALDAKPASTQGDDDDDDKKEVDDLAGLMDNLGIGNAVKCSICMSELPRGWKGGSECEDCQETVAKVSRRKSLLVHQTKKKNVVLDSDDEAEDSTLPPTSTKIRKMLEILEAIYQRNKGQRDEEGNRIPSEKTIIFSQFTTMLDLCEPFLTDAGIRWTRFDGSMKAEAREEALNKVRNDKKCRVILISFKAGGVGLNLTACNNVILLDLWWNPALEDQAFDRAHRLGQKKSVNIYKLTVVESVEDRILQLQDQKRELAAAALAGGKLAKAGLNLNDLMMLFRPKRHHADESDDED